MLVWTPRHFKTHGSHGASKQTSCIAQFFKIKYYIAFLTSMFNIRHNYLEEMYIVSNNICACACIKGVHVMNC
jgi:hypothetical protein